MNILLVSCSLSPDSRSRVLINEAKPDLESLGATVRSLDLREHPLPMCDGETCDERTIAPLRDAIEWADAILLAVPIYNYDVNAAAKNLVEHTGSSWENKIVGFLCAAGGHGSYMSVMGLANSLMLDFRCLIVPRFVYAVSKDFAGEKIESPRVRERIKQLCAETVRIAGALAKSPTSG